MLTTVIKPNTYQDSVSLMLLSQQLSALSGVNKVSVMMGTPANKDILRSTGFDSPELAGAAPGDLVLGVDVEDPDDVDNVIVKAEEALRSQASRSSSSGLRTVRSLSRALKVSPDTNLALVSIPGEYVADEVAGLLEHDINVMIFSDNVSIADELQLKQTARERGLLVMGPDCGTASIHGVPLAFANVVSSGSIGIVGASGTGVQEVMAQIDQLGGGISNAIGLGGRDLSADIGGIMCLQALDVLDNDPATSTIVLISKPPASDVRQRVEKHAQQLSKPVVAVFLGEKPDTPNDRNIDYTYTLADAAARAIELAGQGRSVFASTQRWIKGLYTGGTLANEAAMLVRHHLGLTDSDPTHAQGYVLRVDGNEIVDLGDDTYTKGRPHPMIDPTARAERLPAVFDDEGTAVLLLDVVIGFGAADDPAGAIAPAIRDGLARAAKTGRQIAVVASVCGTRQDFQGYEDQVTKLRDAGVTVLPNNASAVRHALALVSTREHQLSESKPTATAPRITQLINDGPAVLNIGLRSFAETLTTVGVTTVQYDWAPIAGGDRRLISFLRALDNI